MRLFLFPFNGTDSDREKLRWLLSLRFHMIFGIVGLAFLGNYYDFIRPDKYVLYFSATIISLITTTTTYWIWKKDVKISQAFILFQLVIDLVIFTALLFASGGLANPFSAVFYIHAIIGGMLLEIGFSVAYLMFVISALAYIQYLSVSFLSFSSTHLFPTFFAQYFVTLAAWLLARSLQRHLFDNQLKLNQLKIASERMDRLRSVGALMAGLSHEFASPLNAMKIQVERIRRKDSRPSETEDYQVVMDSLERCSEVLKKINSVQLDSSAHTVERINVSELVGEIVEVWKTDYPTAEVEMRIDPGMTFQIPVLNFTQVILNLLDNSFEASEKSAAIKIFSPGKSKLILEDSGSGFSQDALNRFGEPFNSTKVTGTGLGLYSSLLFMNSIGGTLQIRNNPIGAVVELIFPGELKHGK